MIATTWSLTRMWSLDGLPGLRLWAVKSETKLKKKESNYKTIRPSEACRA
jgi:hypothetical protein